MTTTINASPTNGLVQTADGSGVLKVQSNGVTTNALAWVKFVGSSGSTNASYNISSVTRSSAGLYVVNFTNALTDANYTPVVCGSSNLTNGTQSWGMVYTATTQTTTAFGVAYQNMGAGGGTYTNSDPVSGFVVVFGN
jgi:hypothetical protein